MLEKSIPARLQSAITPEELRTALAKCTVEKKSLVEYVLADERVSEESLADTIASYLRFQRINLPTSNVDPEAVKLLPEEMAVKYICIPIRVEDRHLQLAMADPTDVHALQDIQFVLGRTVKVFVCTRTEILDAIEKYYKSDDTLKEFTDSLDDAKDLTITSFESTDAEVDVSKSKSASQLAPVVKVVNLIIQDAIKQRATDIHVEPTLNDLQVRIRTDGVLRPLMQLPKWLTTPVCSRLKILSRLDIGQRRIPQDGRLKVSMEDRTFDLRVATLPTLFGEKVVMRILSTEATLPNLDSLALDNHDSRILLGALMQPQGLILVTGPTGSGKTTTLCACLGHRKSPGVNIITVEDPIEYQIPGINQVQVNPKAGLTFASALRSILRQDPDIVLVGEMRDLETTDIAIHAALTGHLVLSTLHTNSAIASLTRLMDLGVDPVLINTSITLIMAQRLLRKLCRECRQPSDPPLWMLEKLGIQKDDTVYYQPAGCPKCGGTGYAGRRAVIELLPMNKAVREMVANRQSEGEIRTAQRRRGMKFLLDRGLELVRNGTTDVSELFRALQLEDVEESPVARCHNCSTEIEPGFTICPNCLTTLNLVCQQCNQPVKKDWKVCPYCKNSIAAIPFQLPAADASAAAAASEAASSMEPNLTQPQASPQEDRSQSKRLESLPERKDADRSPEATAHRQSPPAEPTASAKKPYILIVDDDASIRTIVQKSLEQLPFPIETQIAADGFQALKMIEKSAPDLIVLDVMMPGMDGFSVCERLRTEVKTAFIPIMMLTANSNEEARIRGYLVGADDYVAKPFNVPELNARVARLLRRTYGIS